jgi:UDP-N-acetylglucosamine 4,6-dehydratase/5-epimerase
LAQALKELFNVDNEIKVIGTRHGEKMYEVLLTKEEAAKAIDLGDYYRVPADNRDLNYGKYLEEGSPRISLTDEYNSNNTKILTVEEIKDRLLTLDEIKEELYKWEAK